MDTIKLLRTTFAVLLALTSMRTTPIIAFALMGLLAPGCQRYAQSTPRHVHEGDHEWNYKRVFGSRPSEVTVVNSIVITYSWRPGVITTDDFEFELLTPKWWIEDRLRTSEPMPELAKGDNEFAKRWIGARKEHPIRPWYAPKPLDSYDLYCDHTSAMYVQMLVDNEVVGGRYRVFISKH